MKDIVFAAVLSAVLFAWFLSYAIDRDTKAKAVCEAKGGALIKAASEYVCVPVIK